MQNQSILSFLPLYLFTKQLSPDGFVHEQRRAWNSVADLFGALYGVHHSLLLISLSFSCEGLGIPVPALWTLF